MAKFSTLPAHLQAAYYRDPRMRMVQALQSSAADTSPVNHPLQGVARLAQAWAANKRADRIGAEYDDKGKAYQSALARLLSGDKSAASDPALSGSGIPGAMVAQALTPEKPQDQWQGLKVVGDDVLGIGEDGAPHVVYDGQPAPTGRQRDLMAAGYVPGTPEYQEALKVSMNKPGVSVNMQPGETKANEELGKAIGTRLAGQLEAGDKALGNFRTLTLMESAANQYEQAGGSLGALAGPQAFATALMQATNFDPESLGLPSDAGPAQVLNSLSNKLVLGKIGGPNGMPANNFSDADRKFIESTVPRLDDTPEAFRAKLFIDRRMNERAITIGEIVSEGYAAGKSAQEISQDVSKVRRQPLFTEDEIKTLKQAGQSGKVEAVSDEEKPTPRRVIRDPKTGGLMFAPPVENEGLRRGLDVQ